MAITRKIMLKILLGIGLVFFLLFCLIIFSILYESKKDVSTEVLFEHVLDKPHTIKEVSTMRWNENNLRFQNHSLVIGEESYFDRDDIKSVKRYQPGDKISFHSAKSYYSIHVDYTYYLIGRDTLDSGEVIEFEYYYTPSPASSLW